MSDDNQELSVLKKLLDKKQIELTRVVEALGARKRIPLNLKEGILKNRSDMLRLLGDSDAHFIDSNSDSSACNDLVKCAIEMAVDFEKYSDLKPDDVYKLEVKRDKLASSVQSIKDTIELLEIELKESSEQDLTDQQPQESANE
jgi:hypothetical protein